MNEEFVEQSRRFADILHKEKHSILDSWVEKNRNQHPAVRELDEHDLKDHLPDIFDDMVGAFGDLATAPDSTTLPTIPRKHPREHGQHRVALGLSLETVVKEYALLRQISLRRVTAHHDRWDEQVAVLHSFIDQAIVEAVVAYAKDERERYEAEHQRRSQYERHLLGIVSHDLRSPLNAIALGAGLLMQRPDRSERELRLLAGITSAVTRASRLIADLIDFTALRLGKGLQIKPEPTDLHELARQTITELQVQHPLRQFDLQHRGDVSGRWDPDRLVQALTNLLSNALQHGYADSPVRVVIEGTGSEVNLSVNNRGRPIPPDQRDRIFEVMERGTDRHSKTRGLGLGLYVVEQIVVAHNGTIRVDSDEPNGTTFFITLPREPDSGSPDGG